MAIDFLTDDLINCGSGINGALSGDLTISVWIKQPAFKSPPARYGIVTIGSMRFATAGNPNDDLGWNRPGVYSADANSANMSSGVWYHLALTQSTATLNATNAKIYKNAVAEAITPSGSGSVDYSGSTFIGLAGIDYFDGFISEVAIWDAVLSLAEVEQLYNSKIKGMPLQVRPANLLAYYPMDDSPDGTSADGDTVKDASGSGNNGTGDDGANNIGLTWKAEEVLSYLPSVLPVLFVPAIAEAIMNQFQGPNLGADLYNGSFM